MKSPRKRGLKTIIRHNIVHELYAQLRSQLGIYPDAVAKGTIYAHISEKCGLSTKEVAYILNHTVYVPPSEIEAEIS